MKRPRVLFAALALACAPAAPLSADDDTGLWATAIGSAKLSGPWSARLLVQTRMIDDMSRLERTVLRPSLGYQVNGWLRARFGYDAHFIESPADRIEHRIWQQLSTKWTLNALSLTTRTRVEERLIENTDEAAVRLRLKAGVSHPIADGSWYATASNEYFVGLNDVDGGPRSGFDQNRLYFGVGHNVSDNVTAEVGYQLQYIDRASAENISVHQLMLTLKLR